jgi:hypothetical protein
MLVNERLPGFLSIPATRPKDQLEKNHNEEALVLILPAQKSYLGLNPNIKQSLS